MKTLLHIEDYIEELASISNNLIISYAGNNHIGNTPPSSYRLARYDEQVVQSIAEHTCYAQGALTDRQGDLAIKLLQTYKRQFAKNGIDVTPMLDSPSYRLPLRTIDRSKRAWIHNDKIHLYFPYSKELVGSAQKYKPQANGSMNWDPTTKVWTLGLTESNVNWVVAWGSMHGFKIADELSLLFKKIIKCEETNFEIKLVKDGENYTISNADPNLIDYVNTHLGGFGKDNIIKLVDNAGTLGYTIDENLEFPLLADLFVSKRQVYVPSDVDGALNMIFDYADLTQRYPICIYNPSLSELDLSRFKEEEILAFDVYGKSQGRNVDMKDVKVVYAYKLPKEWDFSIPLMVSTVEMLYGGKRMEWLSRAEKIVYYCKTLLKDLNE